MPTVTWRNLPKEKRARITRAAITEFARRGFSSGSMNVIARDAGIAKGSLFQYFDDKLDLFTTVSRLANEDLGAAMLEGVDLAHDPLFPTLRTIFTRWIAYFRDHPLVRAAGFTTAQEIDEEARSAVRSVTNAAFVEVLLPMVQRASDAGELRSGVDVEQVVSMVVLVLRHLSAAPFYPHTDPILRLSELPAADVDRIALDFFDALERAYSSSPREDR